MSADVKIAVLENSVESIEKKIDKMEQSMETFLEKLEQNYVPRKEYDALVTQVEKHDNRMWAGIIALLLFIADMAWSWFKRG